MTGFDVGRVRDSSRSWLRQPRKSGFAKVIGNTNTFEGNVLDQVADMGVVRDFHNGSVVESDVLAAVA